MTWWFGTADDRLIFVLRNGTAKCLNADPALTIVTS
jgi:hypothetical protein